MKKLLCSVYVLLMVVISLTAYAASPDESLTTTWGRIKGEAGSAKAAPPADGPAVEAKPVRALPVGHGLELWVFVFPAADGEKGIPGKSRLAPEDICTDRDQTGYKLLSFKPNKDGLIFNINPGSIPIDKTAATGAIHESFDAWDKETGITLFTVLDSGGAKKPYSDGNNTVGWVYIVPRTVLAATWIWVNTSTNTIAQADIFYSLYHPWEVFTICNKQSKYEVGNVGTHEVGHVAAQDHTKDEKAYSTMYPSAPKGEVRKRTLTTGDIAGLQAALNK